MVKLKIKPSARKVAEPVKKNLRLLLVPHKHNEYRPYLIRKYGLIILLVLAIGLQLVYNFTKTGSVLGRVTNVTSSGLLVSTNDARKSSGLGSLKLNEQLSEAAQAKAQDMIKKGYWSHVSPEGAEPWSWVGKAGYNYEAAGENLAKNFSVAETVIDAWMGSETHRDNILSTSYQDVGFGVASGEIDGKSTTIVVAFYAEPAQTSVAGAAVNKTVSESAQNVDLSAMTRVGLAIQSLTPAAMVSVALLLIASTVAITAHFYRSKLPKQVQKTWHRHHGVAKASGLLTLTAFLVLLYGGGQI